MNKIEKNKWKYNIKLFGSKKFKGPKQDDEIQLRSLMLEGENLSFNNNYIT